MNKIEAIKIIIDELSKSERESLMEILNGTTVKSREVCPKSNECVLENKACICPSKVWCPLDGKLSEA